jgi:hypothetical protein
MSRIARAITRNLRIPVAGSRLDLSCSVNALGASMPEATVHKDTCPESRKDQIWFTGQFFGVQPISQSLLVKEASHLKFG